LSKLAPPLIYLSLMTMKFFAVRRVRVRPAFAWLYPEIVQGVWMSAARAVRLT
jgi:hypothetical protein